MNCHVLCHANRDIPPKTVTCDRDASRARHPFGVGVTLSRVTVTRLPAVTALPTPEGQPGRHPDCHGPIKLLQTLRLNYRKAGKLIEAKAIARAIDVVRGGGVQ